MLKRLIIVVLLLTALVPFSLPSHVSAVDVIDPVCTNPNAVEKPKFCNDNQSNATENPIVGPNGILTKAVNILSLIAGILAVFAIIIGGVKMIVSSGDSNSVASAKRTVLYAIISLVIVAFAQVGVYFILNKL